MSSANNAISYMSAIMMQGTAAANVSGVSNAQREPKAGSNSFDLVLNRASNNLAQAKETDVSKKVETSKADGGQTKSDLTTQVKNTDTDQNSGQENSNVTTNAVEFEKTTQTATDNTAETTTVITEMTENVQVPEVIETVEEETPVLAETDNTLLEIIDISPEELPKLQEAIKEDVRELISQISEEFDIDEEDIVNAMQYLGLMATDLLSPANIQQVITQAAGPEQTIDLITDSDIYTSLQDLMEGAESMKDELMNEFDLSEEELQTAIDDTGKSFEGNLGEVIKSEQEEIPVTEPEIIVKEDTASKVPVKEAKAPQSEAFTTESSVETPLEDKIQINTQGSKDSGNKSLFHEGTQPQNLFNQVMNNITEAAVNAESFNSVSYTDRAQMENIIRQITDRITISAGTEETSMELALHPASLGNVNILLTSGKDGITAKFTAQNQIVKEAVESQMVNLQQKFEAQGIKVTSVEVTIASHGFEQNLEQGNDRNSDGTNEGRKARGLRRINLAEIDDELAEEAASDAERIAVQMMQHNGNTVDYSA
jgi:flagellar hook-length control protein FliK